MDMHAAFRHECCRDRISCLLCWRQAEQLQEPLSSRQCGQWLILEYLTHSSVSLTDTTHGPSPNQADSSRSHSREICKASEGMAGARRIKRRKPKRQPTQPEPTAFQPTSFQPDWLFPDLQTKSFDSREKPIEDARAQGRHPFKHSKASINSPSKPSASTPVLKLVLNGAKFHRGHQHSKKLPAHPPSRPIQGPNLPTGHLLSLPWEVRQLILDYVYDSAVVIMSTAENFGRNLQGRCTACRSPFDDGGIPEDVFPCLAGKDSEGYLREAWLPDYWFGKTLHYRNLPYERGDKVDKIEREEDARFGAQVLFTNKQIAAEFSEKLYVRTAFVFGSSAKLRKFLNSHDNFARRQSQQWAHLGQQPGILFLHNKENLTNVCLEIKTYGEPELPEFRSLIDKYYASWTETCRQLVREAPNLFNVSITVVVPRPPNRYKCQLDLKAAWVAPMLEFAKARHLQGASVTLLRDKWTTSNGSTEDTCVAFSEVIRRKMKGWPDIDALEALSYFKQEWPAQDRETSEHAWQVVGRANSLDLSAP